MTAKKRAFSSSNGARLEELGLAHLFVAGSKSRKVAEELLTGHRYSRRELSKAAGDLAPSSVSRVVSSLEKNGIEIEHAGSPAGGAEAVYQVKRLPRPIGLPKGAIEAKVLSDEPTVKLIEMEKTTAEGGTAYLATPLGKVRCHVPMHPLLASLAQGLSLLRVVLYPGGGQSWVLGGQIGSLTVTDIEYM